VTALEERAETQRIGALDGLRSIAILLVLMRHFVIGGDPNHGIRSIAYKVADAGWVGVDLFFALSGFLITGILLRSRDLPRRFFNFYMRRTLRILPLYYVALAIVFLIVPAIAAACERIALRDQALFWLYLANFRLRDILSPCAQVGHFWSLAIEEQYYAIWPAVVFLLAPLNARRVCIGIVVMSLGVRVLFVLSHAGWRPYYWTPARADALACGSLVAIAFVTQRHRDLLSRWSTPLIFVTGAALAFLGWRDLLDAPALANETPLTLIDRVLVPFLLAVFFSGLLVITLQRAWLNRALDIAPFRFIARYSYGVYVWHLILLAPIASRTQTLGIWPRAAVLTTASFAAAIASYHLFEERFLRLKRFFPQRHL